MSEVFVYDPFRKYVLEGSVDLDGDDIYIALITSSYVSDEDTWATPVAYNIGDIVIPTTRNYHRYKCTLGGTSTTEPSWGTASGWTYEPGGGRPSWVEYGADVAADEYYAGGFSDWQTSHSYSIGDFVRPTSGNRNGHYYKCTVGGTSHGSVEPTWPTTKGQTVVDNDITWTEWGIDISYHETTGVNYSAGGELLQNKVCSYVGVLGKWDADDTVFGNVTVTFRFAISYKNTTGELITFYVLDTSDIVVAASDFTITWATLGILSVE